MKLPAKLDLSLPSEVRRVAERIEAAGDELWVVGGAVRDHLCGRSIDDWDLATAMSPEVLSRLFPEAVDVEPRYGRLGLRTGTAEIVITTFREEGDYSDHRHPDWVRFVDSLAADARRRDFTINGLYMRALTGSLIDPCHGWPDLVERQLRTIGEPGKRLREDPLRMLRAVRFATALDMQIEARTAVAMRSEAAMLAVLAPARCLAELTLIFTGPGRGMGLQGLAEYRLLGHCLPELAALSAEQCEVTSGILAGLPENSPALSWASLLRVLGSAEAIEAVLKRLAAPRRMRRRVLELYRSQGFRNARRWS